MRAPRILSSTWHCLMNDVAIQETGHKVHACPPPACSPTKLTDLLPSPQIGAMNPMIGFSQLSG